MINNSILNIIDDCILLFDLLISIFSAITVSRFYFDKTNYIAFCNDILIPISELESCDELINVIDECKKNLYINMVKKKNLMR